MVRALLGFALCVTGCNGDGGSGGGTGGASSNGGSAGRDGAAGGAAATSSGGGSSGTGGSIGATGGVVGSGGTTTSTGGSDASIPNGGSAGSGGAALGSGGTSSSGSGGAVGNGGSGGAPGVQDGGANEAGTRDAGRGAADNPPVVSGTRLKGEFVKGADGAKVFRRGVFFDSLLGVECSYASAGDGSLRCFPSREPGAVNGPNITYADPHCTQLVAWLNPSQFGCTGYPKYVVTDSNSSDVCEAPVDQKHVYPVTGHLLGSPQIYVGTPSDCAAQNVTYTGLVAVTVDPELSPTTFVEGTRSVDP